MTGTESLSRAVPITGREESALVPPTTSAEPRRLADELRRRLASIARQVDRTVAATEPSADLLHQLHRAMRQLHLGLVLWGRLLPTRERDALRPAAQRLRRLSRLVGQVRDRDVVLALLEEVRPVPAPRDEARRFHQFVSRLRDDARTSRALLQAFLRTERDGGLFVQIRGALDLTPARTARARLRHLLAEEHSERWDRVRRAHRKARRRPSVDRLHRLRIRLRQLRHASDLVGVVDAAATRSVPVAFRQLQDHLGRLHDLDIAYLTLDVDLVDSPWGAALGARRRSERRAARKSLGALMVDAAAPARTVRRSRAAAA